MARKRIRARYETLRKAQSPREIFEQLSISYILASAAYDALEHLCRRAQMPMRSQGASGREAMSMKFRWRRAYLIAPSQYFRAAARLMPLEYCRDYDYCNSSRFLGGHARAVRRSRRLCWQQGRAILSQHGSKPPIFITASRRSAQNAEMMLACRVLAALPGRRRSRRCFRADKNATTSKKT